MLLREDVLHYGGFHTDFHAAALMIISRGRNYIFVHIPKTGGTSLALALEARAMADDILVGDTPKAQLRQGRVKKLVAPGRLWKHARLSDIDGMQGLPDKPFIFTLVRNPWDRIASFYHWARAQSFDHPLVQAACSYPFHDFVFSEQLGRAAHHDAAQAYVTDRAGRVRCDAFVRLEALKDDLKPVEAHLGFELDVPHVNRSEHLPSAELYDDGSRDRIAGLFASDIARFGYVFPAT